MSHRLIPETGPSPKRCKIETLQQNIGMKSNTMDGISNETFISNDILFSQTEMETNINQVEEVWTTKCEKYFRENLEESFNNVNNTILYNHRNIIEETDENNIFESNSFFLDIKEDNVVNNQKSNENNDMKDCDFYGLPLITKSLFKSYRNIEKFYDWQEECLSLEAIKNRKNLIYALPTSGGKTLVAEVLMLREVLNRKCNALFILPFVAIVQEKIWALSPFAVQLNFLVEEYAAGKGHIPPKKRRKKHSIYIATIEKGLALIRSLIELDRLHEIGLIVVDELHLIGEEGRGGTLETLLATAIFANKGIQIVGMSATIGNLPELAKFLNAEIYQRDFRPVELTEYVKLGNMLHRIRWDNGALEVIPERELSYPYTAAAMSLDPDFLGGLVSEVVPEHSCLVFCPTKRNCENVASLLCKLQRIEMTSHRSAEREILERALRAEGAGGDLARSVRCGVAYHHAGLAGDERALLEHAFRCGVISVLCCTSTLAAGVNLPARRVILRAPYVGRQPLPLAAYRQMTGRAGRAGVCEAGESIVICQPREWEHVRGVLAGGVAAARSVLAAAGGVRALLLGGVALNLADTRPALRRLLQQTLLAVDRSCEDIKALCDDTIRSLLESGALEVEKSKTSIENRDAHPKEENIYNDTRLVVSQLGKAAIKGCMDLKTARQLHMDLDQASRSMVLMGSLHMLYLVTPYDAGGIRPDYRHYYSLYIKLDEEGIQTAKILGITELNAIRMMTGKPITNVSETVLQRFYVALILHDVWNQMPTADVANKYGVSRGAVQSAMFSASSHAAGALRYTTELPEMCWLRALLAELAPRLQYCAAPHLLELLQLPAVRKSRALQLHRAGYRRVADVARAAPGALVSQVPHLSLTAARQLVSSARLILIEKVENLRDEVEDLMEDQFQ